MEVSPFQKNLCTKMLYHYPQYNFILVYLYYFVSVCGLSESANFLSIPGREDVEHSVASYVKNIPEKG